MIDDSSEDSIFQQTKWSSFTAATEIDLETLNILSTYLRYFISLAKSTHFFQQKIKHEYDFVSVNITSGKTANAGSLSRITKVLSRSEI